MFKSYAEWPADVYTNEFGEHISSDEHSTLYAAIMACIKLNKDGFGGDNEKFPIRTWVEEFHGTQEPVLMPAEKVNIETCKDIVSDIMNFCTRSGMMEGQSGELVRNELLKTVTRRLINNK